MIALLAVLTGLVSANIHRCGLGDLIAQGWKPSDPPASGERSPRQIAARAAATSLSSLKTDHFILWWTTSGPHAIQGTAAKAVASGDSVPGLVRACANGLERAWRLYVDTMGYAAPKSLGQGYYWGEKAPSGKYPVEICDISSAMNYNDGGYFGLTLPYTDKSSAMLLASNVTAFGSWSDVHDLDGTVQTEVYASDWNTVMQATAAHEEFHAVQFHYEVPLTSLHVLFESSAVAMETQVIPWETDYLYFAAKELCPMASLTPLLSATSTEGYPHGWYVKQIMQDFGDTILQRAWQRRLAYPSESIKTSLGGVLSAAGSSFDTSLARYALRLGLTGRRYAWLSPGFSSFSDADAFPTLSGTKTVATSPDTLVLDSGAIQEWIDTTGNSVDRIVGWIPDAGANLAHAWKNGSASGSERLRGSIRQAASSTRQDVWAFSNPGPLAALRKYATSESSRSYLWTATAPARTSTTSGQTLTWTESAGAVLSGKAVLDTVCTPLLHTDVWTPLSAEDPFAASVLAEGGGHAFVLEDADRILSLKGAVLTVPYAFKSVWTGNGNGVWSLASASSSGSSTSISLGDLDLSVPVRILGTTGAATKSIVSAPYPNPYWDGDPRCKSTPLKCQGGGLIHFPITGAVDDATLEIIASDGTVVRRLESASGKAEITWDVRNGSSNMVRSGVYWYVWQGVAGATRGKLIISR